MSTTPEGKIKAMVKKALASLKCSPYSFMPVQSGYGSTSLDFLACISGRFVAIETKADEKKPLTPRQVATRDAIHRAGGKVFVVYDQASCDQMTAQLILMMEFDNDPNYPRDARGPLGHASTAQEQAHRPQHLRQQLPDEASQQAAGGDYGAPRNAPNR